MCVGQPHSWCLRSRSHHVWLSWQHRKSDSAAGGQASPDIERCQGILAPDQTIKELSRFIPISNSNASLKLQCRIAREETTFFSRHLQLQSILSASGRDNPADRRSCPEIVKPLLIARHSPWVQRVPQMPQLGRGDKFWHRRLAWWQRPTTP